MSKLTGFLLHSVRGRIIVSVVLLQAVLMSLIVADMVARQREFMQHQLASEGDSLARTLAVNAPTWLIANDVHGMDELVGSLKSAPNLQLALIVDRNGKTRASTDASLYNQALVDDISRKVLSEDDGIHQIWHDGMVDSAADIVAGGQVIGHARVILDAAPVRAELAAVTAKGVAYAMFAIVVGALVAWLVVRTVTARLAQLSDAADRIAAGTLDARLADDTGRDEVSRLTRDFAQMVSALAEDRQRRDAAESSLFAEKERAQVTLASIGDAVITTDVGGHVQFLNGVAEELTGWSSEEAQGQPLDRVFRIINEGTRETIDNPVQIVLHSGAIVGLANHTVLIRRDGGELNIEDSAAPIRDRDGRIIGVVLVFHDVTKAHEMAKQMGWAATHDALTGLYNRSEFERRLKSLIDHSASGRHHALLYIDLDQFKVINDTCGHAAGDQMLCQIAALMLTCMRESDVLARLGGDEFGVLLENCPAEKGRQIAESILEAVRNFRFSWDDKTFLVGASIGLVEISGQGLDGTRLLAAADTACYAAKDEGRNRIQIFNAADSETIRRSGEMNWVARINRAFDDNRFRLHWQAIEPLQQAAAGRQHGEILLRMADDDGTLVPPAAFLPAAERYTLMPRIDRWVVHHALRWLVDHPAAGQCASINLSGQSLGDEQLLGFVLDQLHHTGIDSSRVCFEITETAAIANLTKAVRFIGALRKRGCLFSLDDFGSGLSSFGYLKNLPVDFVKIDGSFVRNIVRNPIDKAMVSAINNIGHVMGLATIAEFVETDDIKELVRAQGIDFGQGYGISRPVPIEDAYSPR
ncbi:MAG: EAL domain-containing protein [Rhodocyclales bacterium]|nr:EAL domain-containing protein [Rhodocyclales bacterium]